MNNQHRLGRCKIGQKGNHLALFAHEGAVESKRWTYLEGILLAAVVLEILPIAVFEAYTKAHFLFKSLLMTLANLARDTKLA